MTTLSNYHRYIYAVLASLFAVLVLIQTGAIPLLALLPPSWTWAPIALLCVIAFLKMLLPQIQVSTPTPLPPPPLLRDPMMTIVPFPTASAGVISGGPTSLSAVPPPTPAGDSRAIPR